MDIVANMATFPGRIAVALKAIESLAAQVDRVNVILNEYNTIPEGYDVFDNVHYIHPNENLKDVGKFLPGANALDYILYVDDDILYPPDYVERLKSAHFSLESIEAIVGVHGVIYSDYYDGMDGSGRMVSVFYLGNEQPSFVNQLGTGTVMCRGSQAPSFEFMRSSAQFVDVRFARHALRRGYPMVCLARETGWMQQLAVDNSIYNEFTRQTPLEVTREIQEISGFTRIPAGLIDSLALLPGVRT